MEPADYDWLTDARYEVPRRIVGAAPARRRRRSPHRSSRTLFGEYVSLPDSPTRSAVRPSLHHLWRYGQSYGLGGQETRLHAAAAGQAGRHRRHTHSRHDFRIGKGLLLLGREASVWCRYAFQARASRPPYHPPNQQEKEVERSLLASLNVESSRVHAAAQAASWAESGRFGRR